MKRKTSNSRPNSLEIIGARENNLKGIDVEIPHDVLTVVTGYSGSGKSSLAFATAYAEGQRRYIETFSPYTRQFFDRVKKPEALSIQNVRPAIAIQQRTRITSSRSTVGSMTNINDYLKILWSNLSVPTCPGCDEPLTRWTSSALAIHLQSLEKKTTKETTYIICAPLRLLFGEEQLSNEVDRLSTLGFSRFIDSSSLAVKRLEDSSVSLDENGTLLVVLDRIKSSKLIEELSAKRLKESLEQAFRLASGRCSLLVQRKGGEPSLQNYSEAYTCETSKCKESTPDVPLPRPSLFTFNHPLGACSECRGFGAVLELDPERVIPNPNLPLAEGAVHCWATKSSGKEQGKLLRFCKEQGISTDTPWQKLPKADQELVFSHRSRSYRGVFPWFESLERKAYKMHVRVFLARYRGQFTCPECEGSRLKPKGQLFRIRGKSLPELWQMQLVDSLSWLQDTGAEIISNPNLPSSLKDLLSAIEQRMQFMVDLGLPYLSLDRQARTLSGGETQRVNLATALGSDLTSTQFVLDEPSVGLHPRDTARLIRSIHSLRDRGNSVLMVEHDLDCIAAADRVIELGPEAGTAGGEVLFSGPASKWDQSRIANPIADVTPMEVGSGKFLDIKSAQERNLKNINVEIPLNRLTCLTGVSGSGKSTLVSQVIEKAYTRFNNGMRQTKLNRVDGFKHFEQLLVVDQSSIAKSPRANIATYSKIWDTVRSILADTEEARTRSLTKSSFSFNVEAGRCPHCKGAGQIKEDMQFLSDVYIICEHCLGKRFQAAVLEVQHNGKNVDDFLSMTANDCVETFRDYRQVRSAAQNLVRLGLGHLMLGHPLSDLSGGEAQRLKLIPFLQKSQKGSSLLIFDEPTTGLHLHDVKQLVDLLRSLVSNGHTVLCVEHNPTVILASDWLIDLGPEGGDGGGELVLQGTVEKFLQAPEKSNSYTAFYLQEFVKQATTTKSKKKGLGKNSRGEVLSLTNRELTLAGAREHNLKDVNLRLPLGKIVALTGVSGSGKSTIAKDIIYAEGQRRYLDCLSPYARQFIKELSKPDFDYLNNVQPTVCVYQHTFQPSKLSTLATMSEVYNFLRLLYAKCAVQYCPDHPDKRITPLSTEDITDQALAFSGEKIRILAPVIQHKKGFHKTAFQRATDTEITEVRADGHFGSPSKFSEGLERNKSHSVEFVVAHCDPGAIDRELLQHAVDQALAVGGGEIIFWTKSSEKLFSSSRNCPVCQRGFSKPDPEDLSFNSHRGRCDTCSGSGQSKKGDCKSCSGSRLAARGRNLKIEGLGIAEACQFTPPELAVWLRELKLGSNQSMVARPVLRELFDRLRTIEAMGLDYLPLDRSCSTLSNGELQRLRLAAAIGTPLSGAMYIFDEPSAGLHPNDNAKVMAELDTLHNKNNSLILIDHDPETILSAEHILDIGPGGGREGGAVVFNGPIEKFLQCKDSVTAEELRKNTFGIDGRNPQLSEEMLTITSGSCNNVKEISLTLPLHSIVAVAGVSGAGKSSLVHGVIRETLEEGKQKKNGDVVKGKNVLSVSCPIERVLMVDQKPIGKNARSVPASYLGLWNDIRKLFASTIEARSRGWDPSFFSFNTGKGRCSDCGGRGTIKLEMNFLPDASMLCEKCDGKRFSEEANSVRYQGLSVSEVLALTFNEARAIFANHRKIHQLLHFACELGLGYLSLGQPSSTLSGGESQRIKLVSELASRRSNDTLYILDEPTTGLHRADVTRLLVALRNLVCRGNSVIIIEHDHDVIAGADHVIELGPGPADRGGNVIFEGSPDRLQKAQTPWGEIVRRGTTYTGKRSLLKATG